MRSTFGNSLLLLPTFFLFAGASAIRADTLEGGTLTSWNPNFLYSQPTYVPGLYYWNNNSGDGSEDNIGWCLIGSSQCGMPNPPGDIRYYSSSLAAPANMYFLSAGGSLSATIELTLTDQKGLGHGTDLFGFYLTNATGSTIVDPTVIFTSNDASGTVYDWPAGTLPAGQNYGFFIENIQGAGTANASSFTFYTNSALNVATGSESADNLQHFAIFNSGSTYYIGAVDTDACQGNFHAGTNACNPASDFDYNDFVVELVDAPSAGAAPEPASAVLLVCGLLAIALWARRRIA